MKRNTHTNYCHLQRPLARFAALLSLLGLLAITVDSALGDAAPVTLKESASAATVEPWLAYLDKGDFAKSWETAGDAFRKAVTKDQWVASLQSVRKPLGALISRKVNSTKQMKKFPGMPAGSYFVAEFYSSFAEMKSTSETVIFALETNGEWKAAGYLITPRAAQLPVASASCPVVGNEAVTSVLKPICQKSGVPAMAAAVITSEGIRFVGAVGVRKRGTEVPVGLTDLWHLGSDGKAMTSALIASLVESGKLKWDTTVAEVFPELTSKMHPDFQKVTLLHLLSHRAGLPPNLKLEKYLGYEGTALRLRAVREELAKKPQGAPGKGFKYSNVGYIIAGAVVEKITGDTWENAIRKEVFEPLQMITAGFGGTGTQGKIDQPWPHTEDGSPAPDNGADADNPPVMGPAGRIHCSIQDWAKFIQDQLRGARGEKALLKPDSYKKMHTPPFGGDYALGWSTTERPWAGGKVLTHAGDNTMNCANVWVAPLRNFAIIVCVNQSGEAAFNATDEAVVELMKLISEKHAAK